MSRHFNHSMRKLSVNGARSSARVSFWSVSGSLVSTSAKRCAVPIGFSDRAAKRIVKLQSPNLPEFPPDFRLTSAKRSLFGRVIPKEPDSLNRHIQLNFNALNWRSFAAEERDER
jgi:hypothetical protein